MSLFKKEAPPPPPARPAGQGSGPIKIVAAPPVPPERAMEFERLERAQLMHALASPDPSQAARYTSMLGDLDWAVRREAAIALCALGDREALQVLFAPFGAARDLDQLVDATIAVARVMVDPHEATLAAGLNMNAGLMLMELLAQAPYEAVRLAASWGFAKIPSTGAASDAAPLQLITRWFLLRTAELVRAGKKEMAEDERTQLMRSVAQIEADMRRASEPAMAGAPTNTPDLPPPPPV